MSTIRRFPPHLLYPRRVSTKSGVRASLERAAAWFGLPLLALVALAGWALAFPVGSSPDDDFHLPSIWCGMGEREGMCGPEAQGGARAVPEDLVISSVCYVRDPLASAACQGEAFGTPGGDTVEWSRGNYAEHLYPKAFYAATSVLASADIEAGVLRIRLANAVLLVGMIVALFRALPPELRMVAWVPAAVSVVPLGMSLIASTNPSSWAIAGGAVLWLSTYGFFGATGGRALTLAAISGFAVVVGGGSRADMAAYSAIAIFAGASLAATRTKTFWQRAVYPGALILVCIALYFSGSQHAAITGGLVDHAGEGAVSTRDNVLQTLDRLLHFPSLLAGIFGAWPLGWFDTPMPPWLWPVAALPMLAVLLYGLRRAQRRSVVTAVAVTCVMVAAPLVVLAKTRAPVGQYVQPRYVLPLFVMVVGILLLDAARSTSRVNRFAAFGSAAVLAAIHAVALHASMRRYVTGVDVGGFDLDSAREWWWDVPLSPNAVWAVASFAFAGAATLLARMAVGRVNTVATQSSTH